MDALDAKYPFFATAREAVADAAVSLPELVAADAPAVERARERVERALMDGTVASESGAFPTESAYDTQAELLSYPIARILVSLLDSDPAIEKYAAAEAATAIDRIREDLATDDELRSMSTPTVALDDVLAEFDLADAVRPESLRSDPGTGGTTATGSGSAPAATRNTTGSPWDRIFGSRRPRGVSRGGSSTARSTTARCASPVRSFWMRSKPRSKIGSERASRSKLAAGEGSPPSSNPASQTSSGCSPSAPTPARSMWSPLTCSRPACGT